jgi:hypothetical protein
LSIETVVPKVDVNQEASAKGRETDVRQQVRERRRAEHGEFDRWELFRRAVTCDESLDGLIEAVGAYEVYACVGKGAEGVEGGGGLELLRLG